MDRSRERQLGFGFRELVGGPLVFHLWLPAGRCRPQVWGPEWSRSNGDQYRHHGAVFWHFRGRFGVLYGWHSELLALERGRDAGFEWCGQPLQSGGLHAHACGHAYVHGRGQCGCGYSENGLPWSAAQWARHSGLGSHLELEWIRSKHRPLDPKWNGSERRRCYHAHIRRSRRSIGANLFRFGQSGVCE